MRPNKIHTLYNVILFQTIDLYVEQSHLKTNGKSRKARLKVRKKREKYRKCGSEDVRVEGQRSA